MLTNACLGVADNLGLALRVEGGRDVVLSGIGLRKINYKLCVNGGVDMDERQKATCCL